jgi:hypothetical protein
MKSILAEIAVRVVVAVVVYHAVSAYINYHHARNRS